MPPEVKVEIYGSGSPEPPPPVQLRLIKRPGLEGVFVEAVTENGLHYPGGYLLRIGPHGFELIGSVSPNLGLALDRFGQIKKADFC